MTIELLNTFHNSHVTVRLRPDGILTPSQLRRVWRELCGNSECTCGVRGIRDPRFLVREHDLGVVQIVEKKAKGS